VDPVTLIVGALAAGALKGTSETATSAIRDAYAALKTALAARFTERQMPTTVLEDHEDDPEAYEKPLAKKIQQAGAADDPRILELAQTLVQLTAHEGARAGRYTVDVRGSKGVQIGDHGTQHNTFS
jgi:hypothetical protein